MRSNSIRTPISSKDLACLNRLKKKVPEPSSDLRLLENIESQSDYCDLSVSIVSEEMEDNCPPPKSELIKSVKQSLAELKNEATRYINSGDKAIQESNKRLKESVLSLDSVTPDQDSINILNELRQSVRILQERLERNEDLFTSKKTENEELHNIVTSLQTRVKESIVIENSKKSTQCFCVII
jgi:hypothetical protein